jgi:predicted nucleic acid-binding protein
MTVPYFLDTNILIYAASKDDARKRKIASSLLEAGEFGVSAQVLGEFYNTATLKMRDSMTPDQAEAWIGLLSKQQCAAVNADLVISGIRVARRYGISYWDGAIVAAAEALGARVLYTEDLNNGQAYGTVTAINPFIDSARAESFHEPPARPLEGSP